MEDKTTYGVFWRTQDNKEWHSFSCWFSNYTDAYEEMCNATKNPRCIESAIVERTETFDVVTKWENDNGR